MQELQVEECRNPNAAVGTIVRNAGTAVEECRNSNAGAGTRVRNAGTAVEECRNSNAAAGTWPGSGVMTPFGTATNLSRDSWSAIFRPLVMVPPRTSPEIHGLRSSDL